MLSSVDRRQPLAPIDVLTTALPLAHALGSQSGGPRLPGVVTIWHAASRRTGSLVGIARSAQHRDVFAVVSSSAG